VTRKILKHLNLWDPEQPERPVAHAPSLIEHPTYDDPVGSSMEDYVADPVYPMDSFFLKIRPELTRPACAMPTWPADRHSDRPGVDASCLCDPYLAGRQARRQAAYARTRRENGLLQIKFVLTADFPSVNREVTRHDKCVFPYLGVQTMVKHTSCSCLIRPQKSDFLPIESVDSLQIDSSTTHRMFPRQIYIPEIGHICNIFRS